MSPHTMPIGPAPRSPGELFEARRSRFLDQLGEGVAVIPSARELLKSRDTEVPYRPSSDLYYLTGSLEPDSVAVLTPHSATERFTLFVRDRDPEREAWAGPRLGVEGSAAALGADAVYPITELATRLPAMLKPAERIHFPIGAFAEVDDLVLEALLTARRLRQRSGAGPTAIVDLEATTGAMRVVKDAAEIERITTAAKIAAAGHLAAMARARPGVGEWELQAALEGAFMAFGGAVPSFPSIVASGANATVLHYVANRDSVGESDLVLIDAGAEWGMYCSDITRTFPATGRFSGAQRDLYEVVLAAEDAAIAAAQPGASVSSLHDAAVRVLVQGMLDFGILTGTSLDEAIDSGAYKRHYLHQTSHWLGLDVHDVGLYRNDDGAVPLEPGMVLTVEPGLYLRAEDESLPRHFRGVGIRIEDDVVITPTGNEVITREVPVSPTEIEALVGQG